MILAKELTFTPSGFGSLRAEKLPDPEPQELMIEVLSSSNKIFQFFRRTSPSVVIHGTSGEYAAKSIADIRT